MHRHLFVVTVASLALAMAPGATGEPRTERAGSAVRIWEIRYQTHDGLTRPAYVVLPRWYGPRKDPPIPLVISPHGRGVSGRANARLWANLPSLGGFAVVSPEGQGRRLERYSWGYTGQVSDLARMPAIIRGALPWLRIDRRRVYAVGGSMGGQEALLLLARHPRLLAGVAAFDAVTDLAGRYRAFPRTECNSRCLEVWGEPIGIGLQRLAREEVGGSPLERPGPYALRSPITYAGSVATAGVPVQLWWSVADGIVTDQQNQSGRFFFRARQLDPATPIVQFIGRWRHSREMQPGSKLRIALARFDLLPARFARKPCHMTVDATGHLRPQRGIRVAESCWELARRPR
jgi:pimeloyl-ACP methyl ester carboxylesterase